MATDSSGYTQNCSRVSCGVVQPRCPFWDRPVQPPPSPHWLSSAALTTLSLFLAVCFDRFYSSSQNVSRSCQTLPGPSVNPPLYHHNQNSFKEKTRRETPTPGLLETLLLCGPCCQHGMSTGHRCSALGFYRICVVLMSHLWLQPLTSESRGTVVGGCIIFR